MHFFVPDVQGDVLGFIFVPHAHTLRTPQSTVTQVPSRLVTCAECRHTAAPFVCPTIPNIKSNVGRNGNHHIVAFCQFSLPLLCVCFFCSHFRIVTYPCRNRFPDTMLYMAAVAKTAVTSKFDLCCRSLSAQRAGMANARDAPTNLMSDVCTEQCTLCLFYFR